MGCFSTAGRSGGVLGARERSLGWCGICAFEVGEEDEKWTGPYQGRRTAYTGCRDWKRMGIHKKSDCTVLRRCNCYILEFGRDCASVGADNTFVFCPRRKH